jgi:ABC-type branched-subunit amino acid transport system substrate-binding protein
MLVALWLPQRSIAAGDPIELNAILSLTGSGAFLGTAEQSGLLQAAEEVNKAGGIAGRQV